MNNLSDKEKIEKLTEENRVLFEAISLVPDFAAGIMVSLKADDKFEAFKKAEKLNVFAVNAMSKAKGGPGVTLPE
jgi:hypothetical protein